VNKMLDVANKYEAELQRLLMDTWHDEKYKFYHSCYSEAYKAADSTWNSHQFVSIDKDGKILGFISYNINRPNDCVSSIGAINFSDNKVIYGRDLMNVIADIFEKYNFRKIAFSVIVGNPIERSYDRLVAKYGGRIVGVYKEDSKLMDNKFYDSKMYEIFRDDYLKSKRQ